MQETSTTLQTAKKSSAINPIIIIGVLFFVFGFVTWLNSVLVPYLKIACQLTNLESYLVATAFYIAYLVMAVPSSMVLKKFGFKNGMAIGLLIMAVGAIIFIPAALTRTYAFFLAGLFVQGMGLAILQTASNPYVVVLGPAESAAKRISIMGIFNKSAGAIAPIALGVVALKNVDQLKVKLATMSAAEKIPLLNELALRVVVPYICIMVSLVILAVLTYRSTLPEIDTEHEDETTALANSGKTSVFQFPNLVLGIVALFLYVGAEVLAGDSIISYGSAQNIPLSTAKFFATFTMISMLVGYVIGIICIPKYITQQKALVISAILGFIFSILALVTHGYASVFCIALLGLANALMWPAIWPLALNGLGKFTKIASSLLVMGISGAAVIPPLYGHFVDLYSAQTAYLILLPIYLFILYYAAWGHKLGKTTA
ncbi:sugar MFS transporter [Mucilaginibacter sp. BT774]|uniref:sugar MFS transporter n=1 Tax=Mucilaginibacter sp. BT774 TaxID=3062276 RepID=UPI002674F637|nr:sugar MFS transporter [Mucilaginibacter sp. BT774]MDO3625307.1 sugar MFS transporter [Mucilaginibacter sp. BT774]